MVILVQNNRLNSAVQSAASYNALMDSTQSELVAFDFHAIQRYLGIPLYQKELFLLNS